VPDWLFYAVPIAAGVFLLVSITMQRWMRRLQDPDKHVTPATLMASGGDADEDEPAHR
jgi:hypothetical protein